MGPATPTGALTALLVPSSLLLAAFPVALAGLTLFVTGGGGDGLFARLPATGLLAHCTPAFPGHWASMLLNSRFLSPVTCGRALDPLNFAYTH